MAKGDAAVAVAVAVVAAAAAAAAAPTTAMFLDLLSAEEIGRAASRSMRI